MKKYVTPKCTVICLYEEHDLLQNTSFNKDDIHDGNDGNDGDADSNYRTSLWSDFE